jgi:ubiquitin-like protein Nedd8
LKWPVDSEVGTRAWLGGITLDPSKSFNDYAIRSGMVIHLAFGMEIFLKFLQGTLIPICVQPDTSVLDLKKLVEATKGFPRDIVRLVTNGRQLEDEKSLQEYAVQGGCTIHVLQRLCG